MTGSDADVLVISSYPLTDRYRAALHAKVEGNMEFVTAGKLRANGTKALLRRQFASRYRRVIVASESADAASFVPLIALVALGFRWPRVDLVDPDLRMRRLYPWEIALGGAKIFTASADAALAKQSAGRAIRALQQAPQTPDPGLRGGWAGQRILYLKNMMWFGVQAGGSVGHVAGVINAFQGAGASVSLLAAGKSPMVDPGVRQVQPRSIATFGLPSEGNIFRMQRNAIRAALAEARRIGATIVYQRLTLGDFTGAIVASELGIPLVVEYNGSELWCIRNWGAGVRYQSEFQAAEEMMLARANYLFTISEVLRDELLARGVPATRVGWYPNGFDPQVFDPARFPQVERESLRTRLGIAPDERLVTFVGTFGDWHGADVLARAAVLAEGQDGWLDRERVRFLFVGDGKNRERCEQILAGSAAGKRCTFTGLIPQHATPAYLAASDVLASPHVPNPDGTNFFGSPTKLFEYMAMGKPIVASALGQIADVLEDGRTALLATPGDVEELARGLRRVVTDPTLAAKLGDNARKEALARFSWSRHVEAMRAGIEGINAP
jgi:glycosyltransferase involved in cell wall biosynthesis